MGIDLKVSGNSSLIAMEFRAAALDMKEKATVRALNKMGEQLVTAMSREVRRVGYNLKASVIKKGLRLRRASSGDLRVVVVASGRPVPLVNYSARQTSKGVTVNVLKGRKLISEAFIATMPSGHRGVYVREGEGKHVKVTKGGKVRWHQLPIRELFGPSVPDGVANAEVQQALAQLVEEKYPKLLEHESAWLAKRGRG
jgi:hypothetical protein